MASEREYCEVCGELLMGVHYVSIEGDVCCLRCSRDIEEAQRELEEEDALDDLAMLMEETNGDP